MTSMIARRAVQVWLAAALGLAAVSASAGEPAAVADTRVLLPVPDGFVVAETFAGIAREDAQAAVMISELPEAYATILASFTETALARRGMRLRERQAVEIDGRAATLFDVDQSVGATPYRKWIGMFGDETRTVIVTATVPASGVDELGDTLRSVVLGARIDRGETEPTQKHALLLSCDREPVLLGGAVACALRIEGYRPSGLPGKIEPAGHAFVPGARLAPGDAGFVYRFQVVPDRVGNHVVGPLSLDFEGETLTSNPLALRVLPRPDGDAPVAIGATPSRVAVGEPFDVVVVERGVVLGGLRAEPSVRVGGKPVVTAREPGPVAVLRGDPELEIERGASVTRSASGVPNERVTFYRAVARRPGRLTIDDRLVEGLPDDAGVEIAPATVEVVAGGS